ncbi:inositol monophosphatase family protein [Stackebrandtia albiflava]
MDTVITAAEYHHIADTVKHIADAEILPRFRHLTDADITEKNPGDLVTTADRITEERLTETLEKTLPGSITVGEEAVSADPTVLDRLHTDQPVWIIDPVDGTSNFVNGDPYYACLVSLTRNGDTIASWLYAPSLHTTAGAHTGRGAWINDQPAHAADPTPPPATLDIVTTHRKHATPHHRALIDTVAADPHTHTSDCRAAGLSYIDLTRGRHEALLYTWENPWDHATGLHIYTTAGGHHQTHDGHTFRLAGDNALPFIVGQPHTIDRVRALIT